MLLGGGYGFMASEMYGFQNLSQNYVSHGLIIVVAQYRLGIYGEYQSKSNTIFRQLFISRLWLNRRLNVARQFGSSRRVRCVWLDSRKY